MVQIAVQKNAVLLRRFQFQEKRLRARSDLRRQRRDGHAALELGHLIFVSGPSGDAGTAGLQLFDRVADDVRRFIVAAFQRKRLQPCAGDNALQQDCVRIVLQNAYRSDALVQRDKARTRRLVAIGLEHFQDGTILAAPDKAKPRAVRFERFAVDRQPPLGEVGVELSEPAHPSASAFLGRRTGRKRNAGN